MHHRSMPRARLLRGGVLAATIVVAAAAFAQPRGKPAPHASPKPKPAASASGENPYEDKGAAAAPQPTATSAGSQAPPAVDGGLATPPPAPEIGEGGRLSPLNPAANEFSDAGAPSPTIDYDLLLADIAALRARVAAVSDTLFHSRMAIALATSGDHGRIATLSVSLDDGVVWTAPASFRAEELAVVYDHAVAPGHHAVTVDVERRDDRGDAFRSAQRSRFTVEVPQDGRLSLEIKLWDDSNMGADFPGDKKGDYELRIRARAKAQPLER
jgi:hypothetical protein